MTGPSCIRRPVASLQNDHASSATGVELVCDQSLAILTPCERGGEHSKFFVSERLTNKSINSHDLQASAAFTRSRPIHRVQLLATHNDPAIQPSWDQHLLAHGSRLGQGFPSFGSTHAKA